MQRTLVLVLVLNAIGLAGCMLDRSAILCGDCGDASADSMVLADGDLPDAHDSGLDAGADADMVDAYMDDASMLPDSGFDAGSDAGTDAGTDAGSDAGTDAGRPDSGSSFDTCSDETGVCLHFQNVPASPAVVGWMVDVVWTHAGGSVEDLGWMVVTCSGGLRSADAVTTECLTTMPPRPGDAVGLALVYAYPVYAGMVPVCSLAGCPNYPAGYSVWNNTVSVTFMTETVSGTPAGRITVLRLAL